MKGIFSVYKPKGPTSHDIINILRKITGIRKIGHAGTLDPLASGVLVVGIGREKTKKLQAIVKDEKEYLATIRLGAESTTDDEEGEKIITPRVVKPKIAEIQKIIREFQGEIFQTPPMYSAVKIRGRKAYKLARKGEIPLLKPRKVEVKKIRIISYQWPYLTIQATTGPGVYIRSLARDIGRKLNTGGYLYHLERLRVGNFTQEESLTIEQIQKIAQNHPPATAVSYASRNKTLSSEKGEEKENNGNEKMEEIENKEKEK